MTGDTVGSGVLATVAHLRRARTFRRARVLAALGAALTFGLAVTLMVGQSLYSPTTVLRVLTGADVHGASFTLLDLRLPRAILAILAGAAFGLGGSAFQTLLRNPLASPDIIGISAGASAAAVFCIVVLEVTGPAVSVHAVLAGLGVALLIYLLSWRGGVSGARLILVGIGLSAMLQSLTAYTLSRAPSWSLQEAMRWLSGSVNGAQIDQAAPLVLALVVCGTLLWLRSGDLEAMRMGDEAAAGLGARLALTRVGTILAGVGLVAVATASAGPVAFVAFLSGPIAARITGRDGPILLPAAGVGALLVLVCDFAGQFLLPARYPVGVVTGILGAPYLVYLIVRDNRTGGGR
ncbi:MAG TPA: iron ABC transporter permease [Rhodopila sp.]